MKVIVLAGGGGTRLWPLSREDFPKQFLNFGSGFSLLQKTIQRLLKAPFIEELVVATNIHHQSLVQQQLLAVDPTKKTRILVEPHRRNTAPAIGLAVKYFQDFCHAKKSDVILILPSDHLIEPESIFLQALEEAEEIALNDNQIITFGIRPTRPETGYGYIQIGQKYNALMFHAVRFVEKPVLQIAEQYLVDPQFYWNSGMFVFSIQAFWQQLEEHSPVLNRLFQGNYNEIIDRFAQMPDLSIDYALMEKSKDILVCPLAVSWSDVGSWDSVYEAMEKDLNQNVKIGQVLDINTKNSLIIGGKRLISTIGLEDMLIVETEDAVFISKKGESQQVKALVQELILQGRKEGIFHAKQTHSWGNAHVLDRGKDYTIQKIQIFPGKQYAHKKGMNNQEKWIPLGQENKISRLPVDLEGNEEFIICNPTDELLEFVLIKNIGIQAICYEKSCNFL